MSLTHTVGEALNKAADKALLTLYGVDVSVVRDEALNAPRGNAQPNAANPFAGMMKAWAVTHVVIRTSKHPETRRVIRDPKTGEALTRNETELYGVAFSMAEVNKMRREARKSGAQSIRVKRIPWGPTNTKH